MTDQQQPPAVPERIWIDPQDSTFWNDTDDVKSLIPYARVHPVDEGRVEKIRQSLERLQLKQDELQELASGDVERAYELTIKDLLGDIRYLLSLRDQSGTVSSSERRCGEAAYSCLRYAEMIESQNDISGQTENWSDFYRGQAHAARQLADAFAATGAGEGEHPASAKRLLGNVKEVHRIVAEGGPEFQQEWSAALHAFRGDEDIDSPVPVDEGEPQRVYCPGCSEAGDVDRAVYHTPPICAPTAAPVVEARIPSDFITATGELKDWNASTVTPSEAARLAKEIVTAWLWHTPEHDQERARVDIERRISALFLSTEATQPAEEGGGENNSHKTIDNSTT